MGGSSSKEEEFDYDGGMHVLNVHQGSPCDAARIEPYFDYFVAVNGVVLGEENNGQGLKSFCAKNIDKTLRVTVYNSRRRTSREVEITPSNSWGGTGLLGADVRYHEFNNSSERVWHVLDVQEHSPAAAAGLHSNIDYIVGLEPPYDDIVALIEDRNMRSVNLLVFSAETLACRSVSLTPNQSWGGEGSIGCHLGSGYLHRLPPFEAPSRSVVAAEPATADSQDLAFGNDDSVMVAAAGERSPQSTDAQNESLFASSDHTLSSHTESASPTNSAISVA